MFSDAFSRDNQLLKADPKHGLYLACGLMVRGQVEISDIRRNIERSVIVSLVFAVCVCKRKLKSAVCFWQRSVTFLELTDKRLFESVYVSNMFLER